MDRNIIFSDLERSIKAENVNLGSLSLNDIPKIVSNVTAIIKKLLKEINNPDELKETILQLVLELFEKYNVIENISKKIFEYSLKDSNIFFKFIINKVINEKVISNIIKNNMKDIVYNLVDYILKNEKN